MFTEVIANRKNAADALRISEGRLQNSLLELARDAIMVEDLEGRIQYWNKSAEQIYGWSAVDVAGRKVCELIYKDIGSFAKARQSVLERGEWNGELRHRAKSGKELVVDSRWVLMGDQEGRPRFILTINTDVTENKRLEAGFLRMQRMESIGALTGGIAHDLNNILAPILMCCEILDSDLSTEATHKLLKTIRLSAQHGADLTRQILSFARGAEGERMKVQPGHLVKDLAQMVFETFPKSIQVNADLDSSLWTIAGNPTQLHQVLLNLCLNARDAMPQGGELKLSANNLRADEDFLASHPEAKPGCYVVITVTDTGLGIPNEIRTHIFDPFFTTKEPGKGTGLGLSTAISIIKSHGGFVDVYSEPGKGTSFKVYLQADPGGSKDAEEKKRPCHNGKMASVVHDKPLIRDVADRQTIFTIFLEAKSGGAVAMKAGCK